MPMVNKSVAVLNELIAPTVIAMGYELLGCLFFSRGRQSLLRIYIDSERGITVDDCQQVSRQISAVLDVEDPISSGYTLEISSPGFDRPLFTREHFQRFIGHQIRVRLHAPEHGRRNYTGLLRAVIDDKVIVEVDGAEFALSLQQIDRANLVPEF